jgi:signal peptidase I
MTTSSRAAAFTGFKRFLFATWLVGPSVLLVKNKVGWMYPVIGRSMSPALPEGDWVLLLKYWPIQKGDVIVREYY